METIQVVLDSKLLRATDQAAHRAKLNRSALIRNAVRMHLKQLRIRDLEERDRRGYASRLPKTLAAPDWESEAVWPEE
jgi:metal-responsive CopG/Arc/MetJ family transcriptional regulator